MLICIYLLHLLDFVFLLSMLSGRISTLRDETCAVSLK